MQTVIFSQYRTGVSSKNQKPYALLEVSDGLQTFLLNVAEECRAGLETVQKFKEIEIEVHVTQSYRGLQGEVVKWNEA